MIFSAAPTAEELVTGTNEMAHARERHLDHAPITEAIIDLRVKARADFATYVDALRAAFASTGDKVDEQRTLEGFLHVVPGTAITQSAVDRGIRGLVFRSKSQAVQASENGFAFSRLPPYTDWDDVRDTALRLWSIYCRVVDVELVGRVGVRYINRFPVPEKKRVFDYLAPPVFMPETVSQEDFRSVLSRLVIYEADSNISARVINTIETDDSATWITIDTDAFKNTEFRADSPELLDTLKELRRVKNRIFFGSITETAAEHFE